MRIAVISDIHANRFGLLAFLRFLDAHPDIQHVLNLGDFVNIGPHPHEVAERVLSDARFVNIAGNNEEALAGDLGEPDGANRHRHWTVARLGKELHSQVIALPSQRVLEMEGFRILMVHSRPGASGELPLIYRGRNLSEFWDDYSQENPDIVLFGHTHAPFYMEHLERHFVNPGAMGLSKGGTVSFCVLNLEPGRFGVEFEAVPWLRQDIAGEFLKKDVPDKEFILQRYFGIHGV
jgi:putative phosphoesterase